MEVIIFAGKGGVGKSTSAAAKALFLAENAKVLLVDYDGGHSLARVLALDKSFPDNVVCETEIGNLSLAVINSFDFDSITRVVEDKTLSTGLYFSQFHEDYGLLPFCDMVTSFFGVPTDTDSISKFISLIRIFKEAKEKNIDYIIIDVEPTAGLKRLLQNMDSVVRSLTNLRNKGWLTLRVVDITWPHVASFIKGDYVTHSDVYTARMEEAAKFILSAKFILVCVPEPGPVAQMDEVKKMVESFGGKISGSIINNIREEHEPEYLQSIIENKPYPFWRARHNIDLNNKTLLIRRNELLTMGHVISQ